MKFKKVTKDELESRAKFNKKHNKGMSWFQHGMGDPAKEAEMFNHMQGSDVPTSAVGGDAGGGEAMGEDLGRDKNKIFAKIKELNPNAKEENYIDKSVNQMLAILYKLRNNQSALDELSLEDETKYCDKCGNQLNDSGECPLCDLGDESILERIDEKLNIIDIDTGNKYDLRTTFRINNWSNLELVELNKLIESNEVNNICKTLNKKLQESFDNWTEATDGEVIAELTNSMLEWNYDKDEIEAAFVYCDYNNIDYKKLEDWEFEYIVMHVNGYSYNPLVSDSQADWDTEFKSIIDSVKVVNEDYKLSDGWTVSDIKLHQSIDWRARNYRDYPVESDTFVGNATLYGFGAPKIKECKFIKYIRSNEIYPPYYAPIDQPFDNVVGPMFDGNKHGRYNIHDRYETTEAYDMLSR